ncbi:hypothetical protein APED_14800 [Acanthopleuribacter pedis]
MRVLLILLLQVCSVIAVAQSAYFDEKVDAAVADLIVTVDETGMMQIKDANVKSLQGQDVIFNTFLGVIDDSGVEHYVGKLITKDPEQVKFMVNEFSKEMIDEKIAELVKKGSLKSGGTAPSGTQVEFIVRTSIDLYKKVARSYANIQPSGSNLAFGKAESSISYTHAAKESTQTKAKDCKNCPSIQSDNYFFAEQPQTSLNAAAKIVYRIPKTNKTIIYGVALCLGEGCEQ